MVGAQINDLHIRLAGRMRLVRGFKARADKLADQAWQDLGLQPDD